MKGSFDIDELAKLDPLEYERLRKEAARSLGIRVAMLDSEVMARRQRSSGATRVIEPWESEVDGEKLLDELEATIKRHIVMTGDEAIAVALWIVHCYVHDANRFSPILGVYSPVRRCGKSTLQNTIARLVPRPVSSSNITTAAIYRSIEQWHPTLVIDEADTFIERNDDMRGIINSGHVRDSAYVIRCEGENNEPRQFSTWTPKSISLTGKRMHNTLEDRAIILTLRRKLKTVRVKRLPRSPDIYDDLKRQCARWALDHFDALSKAEPKLVAAIDDRANDNWEPLFAIADACGGEWPAAAREVAVSLSRTEEQDFGVMLLEDLRAMFEENGGDNLSSEAIAHTFKDMEHRPWPEYAQGKPITPTQIAKLLRPFNIHPRQVRLHDKRLNGYMHSQFKSVFARYLDVMPNVIP
jgi:putative DNA primase/helicase